MTLQEHEPSGPRAFWNACAGVLLIIGTAWGVAVLYATMR